MSDIRWWAFWRRLQYGTGYFLVLALIIAGIYYGYFYSPASCFDNLQNGGELDVDCGGNCTRICAFTVAPPTVTWAKSFAVTDSQYNAVAYIENKNPTAGVPELTYTFRLYDSAGLIVERQGTTYLPANNTFPIFEGRINTNGRVPTETTLTLGKIPLWLPSTFDRSQFTTTNIELLGADARPKLNAQIYNNDLAEVRDVEVVATIFDARGVPLTASQSFIEAIPGRNSVKAVFTWPLPIAKTVRSCAVPTDVILAIDLSGSMNNDQANPPEPITSVLKSAQSFVQNLRSDDQISLVTFATESLINLPLTNNKTTATNLVSALKIDPAEETGSTNTGDALRSALTELNSSRHNENARSVVVLLTDGLATAPDENPDVYANLQADQLKNDGITIYTIGLGTEVNMNFLRQIASEPNLAYTAPNVTTLDAIYKNITAAICEEGAARIDVLPKTDGNFAPYP